MVRGIDKFREFFEGFEDNYVIIGGTACDIHEEANALPPRATKDIDMILVVEALSSDFVVKFWEFVRHADYDNRNRGVNEKDGHEHEYYRFMKPQDLSFPYQVELFSRNLGLMNFPEDMHITPVPVPDDLSSLSAILMDDDYYNFTITHSLLLEGVHIANIESLICLKCKAYLEMVGRKENDEHEDSRDIAKHKKDVFRLTAMLAPSDRFVLPMRLEYDVREFCEAVKHDLPNSDFLKSAGIFNISGQQLKEQLERCFLSATTS